MAIPWGTIKSLLLFFGPLLLPKAIGYYRKIRAAPRAAGVTVQPVPPEAFRALILLAATATFFLVRGLVPAFAPENIFALTQSRLQIPTDVLFNRLASLRGGVGKLTATDEALRARFVNLESRLLYLQFGPEVLSGCLFCTSDDPRSYYYYALPALLAPHLANLVAVSLATSSLVGGRHARGWRGAAALACVLLAAADAYLAGAYNHQSNARALRLGDVEMYFWTARAWRCAGLSALDGLVALLLWLSSTHRAFAAPASPAARVEAAMRRLASARSRLNAVGIVKNTATRDEDLRARAAAYWLHEGRLMRQVMEEREVVEGVNDALLNRVDIRDVSRDAHDYALNVLPLVESETAPAPESTVG
ncbi:hypothetical protein GGR52DRAFT_31526 [Hypoxylon sp. FL1284]|nr:hypothetical protein GGR52DRAFT_31526 [Hypoxylon sp. FL1284]